MLLLIIVAFVAGLVTAVSPCVLPILPIILASGADGDRRRPYLIIAGLIASFSFFTLASVQIIEAFHLPSAVLRDVAIMIIAIFGLTLLVPALGRGWDRLTARLPGAGARLVRPGVAGGLITGVGLGLVWTPCAGPILGAITSLAITAPGGWNALALVVAYALGAGLPLLAIALGGRAVLARLHFRGASAWADRTFGVLVLLMALVMAAGLDTAISADLTNALPDWTNTLQTLERSDPVQAALHDLGLGTNTTTANPANNLAVGALAPEFTGLDHWLGSSPLTLASLRGKVVLVDFWTYSCINCIRTLPYLEGWYQKYAAEGLVIVGVHTPEFAFEHDTANVQAAITHFGLTYPVAQDNEYATWSVYNNEYWPAHYLIDANGHLRATQFGEGNYVQTESDIRSLLVEINAQTVLPTPATSDGPAPFVVNQTGETYLGSERAQSFYGQGVTTSGTANFSFPAQLPDDDFALAGSFDIQKQYITALTSGTQLEMSFYARDVYLVLNANPSVMATVKVNGVVAGNLGSTEDVGPDGNLIISTARLYHLVHLNNPSRATVVITFNGPGAQAYALTFGG